MQSGSPVLKRCPPHIVLLEFSLLLIPNWITERRTKVDDNNFASTIFDTRLYVR